MAAHRPPRAQADSPTGSIGRRLLRLARHRWAEGVLRRSFTPALLERLTDRVAASERLHTGQIRICVEAGLPSSYLWRDASARERAVAQFGKLRVWDTERNNGVLIYLLQAEHAIEIVADRGLARVVTPQEWRAVIDQMSLRFRGLQYEDGLIEAIDAVSSRLVRHFPAAADAPGHPNELPDAPVVD